MAATRTIEGDKLGRPDRVFHRFNRETWTHGYTEPCEQCTNAGEPVHFRAQVKRQFDRAYALALGTYVTSNGGGM